MPIRSDRRSRLLRRRRAVVRVPRVILTEPIAMQLGITAKDGYRGALPRLG
jgi:hypothetical protein